MKRAARAMAIAALVVVGGAACDELTEAVEDNTAPMASASASSSVIVGSMVELDGSASSDTDGDDLTYMWTLLSMPGSSGAQLTGATTADASFTADEPGTYVAELEVSDGTDADADTVEVVATNRAPMAVALPDTTVALDSVVNLVGSGSSDADGHSLTYGWVLEAPAGASAVLSDPTAESPTFTPDALGDYLAILTVDDGWETGTDTAEITVVDPGQPPSIDAVGTAGNIAFGVPHDVFVDATDPEGSALTYAWSLVSGTGSLSFPSAGADTMDTEIQVSAAGSYEIEIAVSDGFHVVADTLDFQAYDPVLSDVAADTTIVRLLNSDYSATSNIDVTAGLAFEPGVIVRFNGSLRLIIDTGGSLNAVGTAADSIRFLGAQASAGYWDGIEIRTVDAANELGYVEVAHGGDAGLANVYLTGSGRIAIHDSRLHSSALYGVAVVLGGSLEGWSANTLRSNGSGALRVPAGVVGELDNASTYGDLSGDRIAIYGSTAALAATWPAADIPFLVTGTVNLEDVITVEPGTEIRVEANDRIIVQNGGALSAVGTSTDSIRIVGEQASAGYWDGLQINTVNAANELTYAEVAHGGDAGLANVSVTGAGSMTITNSRIHDSGQEGVEVATGGSLAGFSQNTFADNLEGALRIPTGIVGELDNASTYAGGSTGHYIAVYSGAVTTAQTWPKTDAPLLVTGTSSLEAAVTVEAGGHIQVEQNDRIVVTSGGSLTAVGTSTDTIRIVGVQDSYGFWDGLQIETVSADNKLVYTEVANGGDAGLSNVFVTGSGQVQLTNSLFRRSSSHGVIVQTGGQLVSFGNNTFSDNQGAALELPAEEVGQLDAASTYADGNGSDYIRTAGTVSTAATWPATDAPILITSTTSIEDQVTVSPGANIRIEENDRITVTGADGQLVANGTAGSMITFAGLQASAGYWDGIDFETTNGNSFQYVDIGYAGDAGLANLFVSGSGAVTVSDSFIHDSATYGVYVQSGGAFVDGGGNTYANNADGDVQIVP